MNIENLIILSLVCVDLYLLISAIDILVVLVQQSLPYFTRFADTTNAIEDPVDESYVKPRYDVAAFRKRMSELMDEDGLYDIPPEPVITNFTGAEIVTVNYEMEQDAHIGR